MGRETVAKDARCQLPVIILPQLSEGLMLQLVGLLLETKVEIKR